MLANSVELPMLPTLLLETNWTCDYFELEPDLYEFMNSESVATLSAWTFDRRRVDNWAAWLQRSFTLRQLDCCVSYLLYIDSAPAGAKIYVNGQRAGIYFPPGLDDPPFELDVTPLVALGENCLAFRVNWDMLGAFSGVRLQAVSCA